MLLMTGNIKRSITENGRKVTFEFRQPSETEINEFLAARYPTDRKHGMRDQSAKARAVFFDQLLIGIEDTGSPAITLEQKGLINPVLKGSIIFGIFEDVPEVDEKN